MPASLLQVECYAGYRADERPVRFRFGAAPERTLEVQEVLDQWHGVGYRCFRVRADDHNLYVLRHHEGEDIWTLDSFRQSEFLPCEFLMSLVLHFHDKLLEKWLNRQ